MGDAMNPIEEWKSLQDESFLYRAVSADQEESYWSRYAPNYDIRRRWGNGVDRELEIVLGFLSPSMSVLEIGAGTGAYTKHVAAKADRVTAVEPSPSMIRLLEANLRTGGMENVSIQQCRWEEADVVPHDVVLAAGCMYVFYDIEQAVTKMLDNAGKMLILTFGKNNRSEIYNDAARMLGVKPPSAGPDYVHLHNVLSHMGIHANVNIIESGKSMIYDDLDHAVNIWAERMALPLEKMGRLRTYLDERMHPIPSGKMSLGEINGITAVLWYKVKNRRA